MKDLIRFVIVLLAALLFTSFAVDKSPGLLLVFNAFSLIVIYFSITKGEVGGAFSGTVCGLVQDAFSSGIFGVAGLTKTLFGILVGYFSQRIFVVPFFRKFVFLLIMASLEFGFWLGLKSVIFSERVLHLGGLVYFQPFVTAFLGSLLFVLKKKFERGTS